MAKPYLLLFATAVLILHVNAIESQPFVKVTSSQLRDKLPTFTKPGFKSLLLLDDKLYVGGEDHFFTQNPEQIDENITDAVKWDLERRCRNLNKCTNQVRNIVPFNQTHLLLCGATGDLAINAFYNIESGELTKDWRKSGVICSANKTEPVQSQITSEDGRQQIFATSRPQERYDSQIKLIKRMPDEEKIIQSPSAMFRDPRFAASFTANDRQDGADVEKIYFVYHERASQPQTINRAARIAQVCANDDGRIYSSKLWWTSLLTLRLVCALGVSGEKSLYLNYVTDMEVVDGKYLYGTFTNSDSGPHLVTAVCAFSLDKIQETFRSGNFWNFNGNLASYEIFLRADVPEQPLSPGSCLQPGMKFNSTRDFSQKFVTFLNKHPLLQESVLSSDPKRNVDDTPPLFVMNSQHFTTIASTEVTSLNGEKYRTFFVGTKSGLLIKLRQISQKTSEMVQLVQYEISNEPILTLKAAPALNQLYVVTNADIKQVPMSDCEIYGEFCTFCNPCRLCMLSHDPSCAWSKSQQQCVSFGANATNADGDLIQDLHLDDVSSCGDVYNMTYYKSAPPSGETVVYGEKEVASKIMNAQWKKQEDGGGAVDNITIEDGKFEVDQTKRLIINDFQIPADYGTYVCEYSIDGIIVGRISYVVTNQIPVDKSDEKNKDGGSDGITKVPSGSTPEVDKSNVVHTDTPVLEGTTTTSGGNGTVVVGEASFSKIPLQILMAVIAVVMLVLVFILFYRCKRNGGSNPCCLRKMTDYEMNVPNTNTQSSPQSIDMNKNMSNNGHIQQKQGGQDEFDYYRDNSEASNFDPSPEKENLIQHGRKVAAVKPNNCSMNFEDYSIPYVDDGYDIGDGLHNNTRSSPLQTSMTLGRHDTKKKKRNLVGRSTSIPAQKIFVTVNNQKHRCSKIIRTERDTYIFEVSGLSDLQITNDDPPHDSEETSFSPSSDWMRPPSTTPPPLSNKLKPDSSCLTSSSSASTIQQQPLQHQHHHNYDDDGDDCDVTQSETPSPIGSLNSLLTAVRIDNIPDDDDDDDDDVTPISTSSSDQYTTAPPSPFKMMTSQSNRSSFA